MEKKQVSGFTLLEILLVLFLMMAIIFMAAPRFNTAKDYTESNADLANRLRIEGAVELYQLDTGTVPERVEDLVSPPQGVMGWRGPYLEQVLVKPTKIGTTYYELDHRGKVIP